MKILEDLFLDQLADMYDAGCRFVKALPKMANAATCPDLKAAIRALLKETVSHAARLKKVFQSFDQRAKGKTCEAAVRPVEEGGEIAANFKGSPTSNAALLSAAQKVEQKWTP